MKDLEVERNVDLKSYNSYGVGGKASYVVKPKNIIELTSVLEELNKNNISWYILGGGTNVILPDEDYNGVIIKLDYFNEFFLDKDFVFAGAGLNLNAFIKKIIDFEYTNLAPLYGIPGTLGGALVGNAGSFNHVIYEYVKSVLILKDMEVIEKSVDNIFYETRNTEFKNSDVIVLGATFKLEKGSKEDALAEIKKNMEFRRDKQPLEYKNAGSVFKNPQMVSAGKLIDDCKLKGLRVNDACVSNKHANFIVNLGNATSCDIINLIEKIKNIVKEEKGIDLELEQVIVSWR